MARESSPAFQFYPQDFLADSKVIAMSSAARGVYITLLCHCWIDGGIPTNPAVIQRLGSYQGTHWETIWSQLRSCFRTSKGRYIQPRIEKERQKQAQYRESGRLGGLASAKRRASESQAKANSSSSSSDLNSNNKLVSNSSVSSEVVRAPLRKANGHEARSKHPIFTGQRLTVFEWQLTDCLGILGPHADAFDLHEWFFALDAHAVATGQVIPKRDSGAWLQAQLVAEAQRRGLPLVMATTATKPTSGNKMLAMVARIDALAAPKKLQS